MNQQQRDLMKLIDKADAALLAERNFGVRWDLLKVKSRAIRKLKEMEVVG